MSLRDAGFQEGRRIGLGVKEQDDTHPTSRPSDMQAVEIRTKLQIEQEGGGTFRTSSKDEEVLLTTGLQFQKAQSISFRSWEGWDEVVMGM